MKIQNVDKEKRINAIIYFCKTTNRLSQTKLYKLLFFLDFLHFKETGRPVTDLEYFAWQRGPVPKELYFEIQNRTAPPEVLKCIIPQKDEVTGKTKALFFKTFQKPRMEIFSDRERKILEKIAFIFKDALAEDMIEITHLKNQPWQKTLDQKGEKAPIDFLLAIDNDAKIDKELAQERLALSRETKKVFGVEK
jgi:uncharacterized phage-associated protein